MKTFRVISSIVLYGISILFILFIVLMYKTYGPYGISQSNVQEGFSILFNKLFSFVIEIIFAILLGIISFIFLSVATVLLITTFRKRTKDNIKN